jgi:hypothetical protein
LRDRPGLVPRVAQDRQRRADLGERQFGGALDRCRADRVGGLRGAVGQQLLRDQAAEGVPDHDRPDRELGKVAGIAGGELGEVGVVTPELEKL